ncbi:hypothetical protein [Maribacter sp.]|uniref:hypothetical protein n=1 Tax=Maribacter sp. TaxID=1897614 RepID=UPI0025BDB3CD|nr:hypothetical protein [Maribacter sp.]
MNEKTMTKKELLNNTNWDEYQMGTCLLFVNVLSKEVPFVFFQKHKPEPSISDKMVESVNDILAINPVEIETIKEVLYEECLFAFQVADYGCEAQEGETHLEAHLREFEIFNKEDAYLKSEIQAVHINQEYDELNGTYSEIKINSASDNLISVIVKNGKIIDYGDDGVTLSVFDTDEQIARKRRKEVLDS